MAQHYEDKEEQLVIGLQGSPLRASSNDSQEQAALQAESEGKATASAATNCAQSSSTAPSSATRRHAAKDSENGGMFTDDHWRCLAHAVYVRFAGISCLYMHEMAVPTMAVC